MTSPQVSVGGKICPPVYFEELKAFPDHNDPSKIITTLGCLDGALEKYLDEKSFNNSIH